MPWRWGLVLLPSVRYVRQSRGKREVVLNRRTALRLEGFSKSGLRPGSKCRGVWRNWPAPALVELRTGVVVSCWGCRSAVRARPEPCRAVARSLVSTAVLSMSCSGRLARALPPLKDSEPEVWQTVCLLAALVSAEAPWPSAADPK